MNTLRGVVPGPLLVFGAAAVAFAAWVGFYTTPARVAPGSTPRIRVLPERLDGAHDPVGAQLESLKPGLTRRATEQQLAGLPEPEVEPVDTSSGKPVFRSRYQITLTRPVTQLTVPARGTFVPGPHVLTVEFDGSAVGHPLARVTVAPAP